MPNVPKSVLQIFYVLRLTLSTLTLNVKYVNGFQLNKCKEILVTYCSCQWISNLLIRKTIGSHY